MVVDFDNYRRKLLSPDEAREVSSKCLIEHIGALRGLMGLCKRVAKNKDRWPPETRMLAKTLVPQIENEIHELKIGIENEKLGEIPF
jgi:hypothetical protein